MRRRENLGFQQLNLILKQVKHLGKRWLQKKHEQELGKVLSSVVSEVERLIISGKLDCRNKIAKNLERYKSILSGRDKITLPKPNPKNVRDI